MRPRIRLFASWNGWTVTRATPPLGPGLRPRVLSRRVSARIRHNVLGGQPPPEGATAFLDLAPLAAADPTFDAIDFWPGLLNACQAGDVQVGIPLQVSASLILFDKAASDAAGVAYLEPGGLGEEFRHAAEMLTV
jgi:hypothetical protein